MTSTTSPHISCFNFPMLIAEAESLSTRAAAVECLYFLA
jgi:hypothetical protein